MSGNTHFVSIEDTSYGGQIANRIGIKIKSMSLFRNVVVVVCILRNGLLLDTTLLKIEGNDYNWNSWRDGEFASLKSTK